MTKQIPKVATTSVDPLQDKILEMRNVIPEAFAENKIDWNKLRETLGEYVDMGTEKYGLNWAGKSNAFKAIRVPATGTLVPQESESVNWDTTENLFIEGDNLEVLKLLQRHYRNKIKMVYIDPPYNTGKDFIYKDNFTENTSDYYERTGQSKGGIKLSSNMESNGRYHSDWLTMMYPRLFLAKNLLKDDGVIFVSIDDNEVANLKILMDEIFGEENLLSQVVRIAKTTSFRGNFFAPRKDYLLCYSKNISELKNFSDEVDESQYKKVEINGNRIGEKYRDDIAFYLSTLETRPNQRYFIECPDGSLVVPPGNTFPPEKPKEGDGVWRWNKDSFESKKDFIVFKNTKSSPLIDKNGNKANWNIYTKSYLNDKIIDGNLPSDVLTGFLNRGGTSELGDLEIPFDFSKPYKLIKYLLKIIKTEDDDIVLDFFAGSGTTAHAVMDLNAEENANRKFICVQIPEETDVKSEAYKAGYKNIAEISRERIRRAGKKLLEDKADINNPRASAFDSGFKSFKLSQSNYRQWSVVTDKDDEQKLKRNLKLFAEKPLVDNYEERSVVYEILTKEGFDINSKVEEKTVKNMEVWVVSGLEKRMFITFAKTLTELNLKDLNISESDIVVCLDSALDDTIKVNLMRNYNVKSI